MCAVPHSGGRNGNGCCNDDAAGGQQAPGSDAGSGHSGASRKRTRAEEERVCAREGEREGEGEGGWGARVSYCGPTRQPTPAHAEALPTGDRPGSAAPSTSNCCPPAPAAAAHPVLEATPAAPCLSCTEPGAAQLRPASPASPQHSRSSGGCGGSGGAAGCGAASPQQQRASSSGGATAACVPAPRPPTRFPSFAFSESLPPPASSGSEHGHRRQASLDAGAGAAGDFCFAAPTGPGGHDVERAESLKTSQVCFCV